MTQKAEPMVNEISFAGQLMFEWFEINRELLKARGFAINALLSNPEAYWIEPSVFVDFETPFYVGELETTIDGRYRYFLHDKNGSNNTNKFEWFIGLDIGAIEYRRKSTYSGDEKDVNWEPQNQEPRVKTRGMNSLESSRATHAVCHVTRALRQRGKPRGIRPSEIEIHSVSDYDSILEPMISQALQPFPQGESDANL